ncbi:hypothetical protein F5Y12DRAFT_715126 [Xylaria sp. FL1777]|nr:hypothetical protein F5Y12DRAFT_715126 [Xylaria sp. FL1777]
MKSILALIACPIAVLAASVPRQNPPVTFTTGAWRTDTPDIIFLGPPINASGGKFYVNRATSTYCPSGVSGLDFYIAPDGSLSYTQAHSAYIPAGSTVTGFHRVGSHEPSSPFYLNSAFASWYLCPVTDGEITHRTYQIFASSQSLQGCYDTRIRTYADTPDQIWQYA